MAANRPARRWLRIALAVAFGFMNLGHGPIMTFAHKAVPDGSARDGTVHQNHSQHHGHGQHHQHAANDHDDGNASDTVHAAGCNAFGCFITVKPALADNRVPMLVPIGKLTPRPRNAGSPAVLEPADPPPRLHV